MPKPKILVVGQTPPPYGGQTVMIEALVNTQFQTLELYHVRVGFNTSFRSLGKYRAAKVTTLFSIIVKSLRMRFRHGIGTLYYPPSGPAFAPAMKDVVLLLFLRPFFKRTIFHFHAAGLSDYVRKLPFLLRVLANAALRKPDVAIQLSELTIDDATYFRARKTVIVNNGVPDIYGKRIEAFSRFRSLESKRILFTGLLYEPKGVLVLLETACLLKEQGLTPEFVLMGEFISSAFEEEVNAFIVKNALTNISFTGVLTGHEKWAAYAAASVFFLPTHHPSESFPVSLLEAMMFSLPVVSTVWHGIRDIVSEGETGFLVPLKDAAAAAEKLKLLLEDDTLRETMGKKARKKYLLRFTLARHLIRMEEILK